MNPKPPEPADTPMSAAAATPPAEPTADQPAAPEQAPSVGETGPAAAVEPLALEATEPGPAGAPMADATGGATPEHTTTLALAGAPAETVADAATAAESAEASAAASAEASTSAPGEAAPPAKTADLSPAACAATLAQHFPALFGAGVALPVKLRIQTDIQQRAPGVFSRKSLSLFLHRHTTSTAYIRALLAATQRFDLDGQPAGDISEEHRAAAVVELDRRKAIVQERRTAQRQQQPPQQRHPRGRPGDQAQRPAQGVQPPATDVADAGLPTAAGEPGPLQQQPRQPRPARPQQPGPQRRAQGPSRDGPRDPRQAGAAARGPGDTSSTGGLAGDRAPRPLRGEGRNEARGPRQGQPGRPERNDRPGPREGGRPWRDEPRGAATAGSAGPADAQHQAPAPSGDPVADAARRERSALLRTFESSTLTKANFLVLKRMTEAELDTQLAQARQERQAAGSAPRDERPGRR